MSDVHYFDVTDALPLAVELAKHLPYYGTDERSTFLPFRNTWIEWETNDRYSNSPKGREGVLLTADWGGHFAHVRQILGYTFEGREVFGALRGMDGREVASVDTLPLGVTGARDPKSEPPTKWRRAWLEAIDRGERSAFNLLALLAIINTPNLIGRVNHAPHRGLERKLLATRGGSAGRYPLHAWTEIKMQVRLSPGLTPGSEPTETHLTGKRALHHCKAFLRVKGGRLEKVREHLRGDAALGIKRSRYVLES